MHKIDSDGATVDNLFTEGNAALSIPATIVSADWLNDVQEELVTVIENAGITLVKGDQDQLYNAIIDLIEGGGRPAPIAATIDNNSGPLDVSGFPTFDTTEIKAIEFLCDIYRKTDTNVVKETGRFYLIWDSEASQWDISFQTVNGDAGVTFSIANVSGTEYKLQYTSNDVTGTTYVGTARITDIKKITI